MKAYQTLDIGTSHPRPVKALRPHVKGGFGFVPGTALLQTMLPVIAGP
jgi:hypothetical protein